MTDSETPEPTPNPAGETRNAPTADFGELRESLPEDLRNEAALAPFTSFEGMARSLVEAQKMVGKRIADASPEELARYDERHGRPRRAEEYELPGGEDGRPAAQGSELVDEARRWFFDAGLSQRQAEILAERWNDFAATQQAQYRQRADESWAHAETALRREWGQVYDRKVAAASRALREIGGENLADFLDETGLGNDPRMIRTFARIAEERGEDGLIGEGSGDFALTPEAARAEITEAMSHPAYFDADHPEHGAAVERMRALFAAAYPEIPE